MLIRYAHKNAGRSSLVSALKIAETSFRCSSPHERHAGAVLPKQSNARQRRAFFVLGGGLGHELLSIIVRFAPILLSTLDPASALRPMARLRPSRPPRKTMIRKMHGNKPMHLYVWCLGAGSNRRPLPLQGSALPTELPKHLPS